jgi:hypothetical protein
LIKKQRKKSKEKGSNLLIVKLKNKLKTSVYKLNLGTKFSKSELMQIMVDLNYISSTANPAQEKLIKNAFVMFGAHEMLDFQDFELLILGIENVYDKSQPSRIVKDGRKLIDVSTPENF